MPNKLLYITGLVISDNEEETKSNINSLLQCAYKFMLRGNHVQLPRPILSYFCGIPNEDIIGKESSEVIKRCDGIVLLEGWNYSDESIEALNIASKQGLEIIFNEKVPYPNDMSTAKSPNEDLINR